MEEIERKERIIIVGDLFPTVHNISFFSKGDIDSLFGKEIMQLFSGADFRVCNLEGALTGHPDKCRKTGPVKVAATSAIEAYKKLGINCCMLANNHATDGGHQGMIDTMRTLDDAGINYLKAFKSPSKMMMRLAKYFPKQYKKWLYRYNERDLMFTLHTLRSEQNRETAIIGIEHLLNM